MYLCVWQTFYISSKIYLNCHLQWRFSMTPIMITITITMLIIIMTMCLYHESVGVKVFGKNTCGGDAYITLQSSLFSLFSHVRNSPWIKASQYKPSFEFKSRVKVIKWCWKKWNEHNLMYICHKQCEIMHKIQRKSSNGQFCCFHYVR